MLKKTLSIIIAALMICAMAACSNTQSSNDSTDTTKSSIIVPEDSSSDEKSEDSSKKNDEQLSVEENSKTEESSNSEENRKTEVSSSENVSANFTSNEKGYLDTTDLFSNRDLLQTPDLSDAKSMTVSDNQTLSITEEGTYVITGSASNCTIRVEADKESKVQIVLDNVSITNESSPAIYVVSADKCFITTTQSSTNTLSVTGTFTADGDTNTDAVIFSKDDIVLNGLGTLTISSAQGNGISGKDGIKATGGTYNITASNHGIEANDFIAVCGGTFEISSSSKDGIHCNNSDDDTVGWIYISDGTLNVKGASDGIQGTTVLQIDGGTINVNSTEGIEATYIQINDGTVNISAIDDGINASKKSTSISTPTVEITGGNVTLTMSGNDVDCIDSNGNIVVSGGTINVNYPEQGPSESFDCDGTATYTGGTIIINGTQVDSIPQSMMGGPGGIGGFGGIRGRGMSAAITNNTNNTFI